MPPLQVKESPGKGLGVFTLADIEEKSVIEFCHSIVLAWRGRYQRDEEIKRYTYWAGCECAECKTHGAQAVLPLGYGCIYNCAESQGAANAGFVVIPRERLVVFMSIKPIKAGEEILTWWGQGYYDTWCRANSAPNNAPLPDPNPEKSGAISVSSQTLPAPSSDLSSGEGMATPESAPSQ